MIKRQDCMKKGQRLSALLGEFLKKEKIIYSPVSSLFISFFTITGFTVL